MKPILLVAIGEVMQEVLGKLKPGLKERFSREVETGRNLPEPAFAYDRKRNQYLSTLILKAVEHQEEYLPYERVLGVADRDLFVPDLNFVFGIAGERVAIISLARLRQEFYGLPKDEALFERRVLTEAVHELGHTYGLGHCKNPRCVMFFSNSLVDTDHKGPDFCRMCRSRLSDYLIELNP